MKYSLEDLDKAILILLPQFKNYPDDVKNEKLSLMTMIAKKVFIYPIFYSSQSSDHIWALGIVKEAFYDFDQNGHFTFGE